MRKRLVGSVAIVGLSVLACGGKAESSAAGGDQNGGVEPPRRQVIDDMDHTEPDSPMLPEGSSGFVWRRGIGNWFLSSAERSLGDAPIDPIVPPRAESTKACHVSGEGFTRGVDLWAELFHPQGLAVDLSDYAGIAFWAKLTSPSSRLVVAVNTGSGYFTAIEGGRPLTSKLLSVPAEWQEFVLSFEELRFYAGAAVSFDFVVGEGGEAFDLWVDDFSFLCRGECP